MEKNEIENLNNLIRLVEHQEVVIFGLESKVEALINSVRELSVKTNNPDIGFNFDNHFWESFHKRFEELNEPSEALRVIHESLSRT